MPEAARTAAIDIVKASRFSMRGVEQPAHPNRQGDMKRRHASNPWTHEGYPACATMCTTCERLHARQFSPRAETIVGAARLQFSLVRNDVGPLAGVGSRDDGDNRIGGADVEDFVRNTGLDEDEVAGCVLDHLLQTVTVFVADAALENVEHHLEADVDVGVASTAGWNSRDVHRERLLAHVLARQSFFVVNAVPVAAVLAGADHQDAVMPFNHAASPQLVNLGIGELASVNHQLPNSPIHKLLVFTLS